MRPDDPAEQSQGDDGLRARASASMWTARDEVRIEPGRVIGPYIIKQLLGEGGHGEVYLADQTEPVQRRVAIKIIKPGMDSKAVLARFEQERQALAVMDHPNVARVLDAGTMLRGVPYFVMDYVDGEPIATYCDRNTLSIRSRLQLFIDVCEAVQHAHMKGIIHRDIKPSNILIAEGDNGPVVKVIDFGVAKALSGTMASSAINTEQGQLVGTREYMSPEQAAMGEADVDTRSDVYSLGVVLYELLAGALPFDSAALRGVGQGQIERFLRERSPVKPSTRISSPEGAAAAKNRRTSRQALARELSRELNWIPLKAMRADRAERYRTASDFADDIRNYLRGQPLEAGPAAATYRLRKFIRRHRGPVMAASLVLLALLAGLIGVSVALAQAAHQRELAQLREREAVGARDAEARQRERAETEAERAQLAETDAGRLADELQTVVDFQASQFSSIDTAQMGQRIHDGIIDLLRSDLPSAADDREQVEHRISLLDQSLAGVNFTDVALQSIEHDIFGRALDAINEQFAEQPLVRARLLQSVAMTFRSLGLLEQAMGTQEEALDVRRRELGDEHVETLYSINQMGALLQQRGRHDEANEHYREALAGRRHVLGPEHPSTLQSINNLGVLLKSQGRYAEATRYLREALDGYRRAFGEDHQYTSTAASNVGAVLQRRGRLAEAEPLFSEALAGFRRTLGKSHPQTLTVTFRLGWILQDLGEVDEAESLYREALAGQRRVLGDMHPSTLTTLNNIGWLLYEQGHLDDAEPYYREALAGRQHVLGIDHAHTLLSTMNLGMLLYSQGDHSAAEPYFREAMDVSQRIHGDTHRSTLRAIGSLSVALRGMGELEEAERLAAEVVRGGRGLSPHDDLFLAVHLSRHALLLTKLSRFEEAERKMLEAHAMFDERIGDEERTIGAVTQLVALYEAWHAADPDAGHARKATAWRANLSPK